MRHTTLGLVFRVGSMLTALGGIFILNACDTQELVAGVRKGSGDGGIKDSSEGKIEADARGDDSSSDAGADATPRPLQDADIRVAVDGAGPETGIIPKDGGPLACKETTLLGRSLPLVETGYGPYSIAMGDLNDDGKLDMVLAANDSEKVSVLLGKGDGTFAAKEDYPIGAGKGYEYAPVVLGDLNGDGKLDIAAADYKAGVASVRLGAGDGTFGDKLDYAAGDGPAALALGDLNGDGKLDLVAVDTRSSSVSVLLGKGDGTFAAKLDSPIGGDPSYSGASVALGDLDSDGKLDLVVAIVQPGAYSVLLGIGDGTFATPVRMPVENNLVALSLLDFNDDDKLDLVLGMIDLGAGVLFGQGDGTFAAPVSYPRGGSLSSLALGDLNGDGKADLAIGFSSSGSGGVGVWFGQGEGTFTHEPSPYPAVNSPTSLTLGDLDGDGKLDIVAVDADADRVSVLLGDGDGSFAAQTDYPTGDDPASIVMGDLNGDGSLDIVTANNLASTVSVLLGMGDGTFADKTDYPTVYYPASVALGDLNGDGELDIVVVGNKKDYGNSTKGTINVLLGTGGGKFAAHVDYQAGVGPDSVALGDLNHDGKLDIVVGNGGYGDYFNGTVSVRLGKGDGTFAANVDISEDSVTRLVLADLDGDGELDIVIVEWTKAMSVMLGKGDGTFAPRVSWGGNVSSFALADWNSDGKLDVVAPGGDWTDVLPGRDDVALESKITYVIGSGPLAVGDLNGDGLLDVVTTVFAGSNASSMVALLASCR